MHLSPTSQPDMRVLHFLQRQLVLFDVKLGAHVPFFFELRLFLSPYEQSLHSSSREDWRQNQAGEKRKAPPADRVFVYVAVIIA